MKIGIVGQGYVGTAVRVVFEEYYDVCTYDINQEISSCQSLDELIDKSDIVFICLPTPMNHNGSCNIDIVKKVVRDIDKIALTQESAEKIGIKPKTETDIIEDKEPKKTEDKIQDGEPIKKNPPEKELLKENSTVVTTDLESQ